MTASGEIDPMNFGGRLELNEGAAALLGEKVSEAENLAQMLHQELRDIHERERASMAQTTALVARYAALGRRIEAEAVEGLSKLQPDTDPAIATSLRVILNLASLLWQAEQTANNVSAAPNVAGKEGPR